MSLKVSVFAHNGMIVMAPNEPEKDIENEWFPTNANRMGCVLCDTKNKLGVSQEALELMKTIQVGRDAIGDIDWWLCGDGKYAFSWFGSIYRVIDPKNAQSARGFKVYQNECTVIPNDLPDEVKTSLVQK